MSLSALLNDEDKEIIPQQQQPQQQQQLSLSERQLKYLKSLNSDFNKYQIRDNFEWLFQDWKFLNLQEFELINEWNFINLKDFNRNKLLLSYHDKSKKRNRSITDKEDYLADLKDNWEKYLQYKNVRLNGTFDISDNETEEEEEEEEEENENENENEHEEVDKKIVEQDNVNNKVAKEDYLMDKTKITTPTKLNKNIVSLKDDANDNNNSETEHEDFDDNDIEQDEEIDEDEPFEDVYKESDNDLDYEDNKSLKQKKFHFNKKLSTPSYNPEDLTIDSDGINISTELNRLFEKDKFQKTKKRRFTNIFIQNYLNEGPDPIQQALQVKITLKQNHSRKLKRLLIDDKRREEKLLQEKLDREIKLAALNNINNNNNNGEGLSTANSSTTNSPSKKKRKLINGEYVLVDDNDNNDNENNNNNNNNNNNINTTGGGGGRRKTHDLPTYGMKMSAREARAIQRHYDNTYTTIWKDMARRDSNRMLRLYQQIQSIRSMNFKKTSSLCAREAKKWQAKNFKQVKDIQTRARRGVREMSNFWKRNEREEREIKKKVEKIALENAKKEEEERENMRQAKKLNFLLTQTELYSHFIGRKIKTDELEGNENNNTNGKDDVDLEITNATKNDFHEIDFDNEDDEQLRLKAAENASSVLAQNRAQAKAFDSKKTRNLENEEENDEDEEDDEELNFQNPTSLGDITLEQPKLLACTLKEYQLKGLNWLANLYDQGINGILADEMGLGKTVQSISVLAHLAEHYNIWGPFLVVTPASTLHNWVNEITKFVPDFKILPYWGNANDRKVLRKFWDRKNLRYGKDAPFHVMVTSYQMVVSDVNYLHKMRWQYMILDEAQAIKSSQSSRWKNLLSFHCRNRLLLTGTPIQNNMQELWALLHFIMPSLFDSHDEFSEWFSKDIESHAEGNGKLNQQQVRRLHMILKPFMLRRIKKNVQSELGDKIEIDVLCDLTQRQKKLYQVLRSQMSSDYDEIEDAAGSDENGSDQGLMNAVMQFRKVCNHPDLFERADVESPFSFATFGKTNYISKNSSGLGGSNTTNNSSTVSVSGMNGSSTNGLPVTVNYANLVDVLYSSRNPIAYHLPRLVYDELLTPHYNNSWTTFNKFVSHIMNIYIPFNNRELSSYLQRIACVNGNDLSDIHHNFLLNRLIKSKNTSNPPLNDFEKSLIVTDKYRKLSDLSKTTTGGVLKSLLNIREHYHESQYFESMNRGYHDGAAATPISIEVLGSSNFTTKIQRELFDPVVSQAFCDIHPVTQYNMRVKKQIPLEKFPVTGLFPSSLNKKFSSSIFMPSMDRFITDSAKLKKLDEMLPILKAQDHRVLIYFQMTKMMDLMEEYLTYKQYNHIRLDGSSKLEDRRDLVHDWQTKPEIFIFLLSTRAGGLGINLTAADTVIFYDSDWNPTIDSQAMDRAHRLGQTRQVTVYRLLVRGTIEERMRDRAKQKEQVQQVVMEGKTQDHHVRTIEASAKIGEKTN